MLETAAGEYVGGTEGGRGLHELGKQLWSGGAAIFNQLLYGIFIRSLESRRGALERGMSAVKQQASNRRQYPGIEQVSSIKESIHLP